MFGKSFNVTEALIEARSVSMSSGPVARALTDVSCSVRAGEFRCSSGSVGMREVDVSQVGRGTDARDRRTMTVGGLSPEKARRNASRVALFFKNRICSRGGT